MENLSIGEAVEVFNTAVATVVDFTQQATQLGDFLLFFDHTIDLFTQTFSGKAKVDFHDLTDVHTRRYTQRVQYDINRSTGAIVRHILDWFDR